MARCSTILTLCWALIQVAWGAELTHPAVKNAASGQLSLSVGTAPFADYGFDAFGFDGAIPGPTFRVKPGEHLAIKFTNNLLSANNAACASTNGEFCEAATSNLHTHGLHVSSKGVEDGLPDYSDDIFVAVAPGGGTASYNFSLPADHMGGTHWYHPHHHHATALQAGGGAVGLLIVEDPDGYLPARYASMQEKLLVISGHNLNTLQTMARSASSGVLENAAATATNAGYDTNVFLVNGQRGPTMTISGNTWYRFRMVYAAVEQSLQLSVTGDGSCTLKLIAKDGIYLPSIPRDITTVHLFPGARADVAVACTCTAYPCSATLGSAGAAGAAGGPGRRLLQRGRMGGGGQGPGAPGAAAAAVELMLLTINQGSASATPDLPTVTPARPCYLADLRSASPDGTGEIGLNGGPRTVTYNGQGQSMTYANTHAGGGTMRTWTPMATLQVGKVYEFSVSGANAHPLHIHVNPYQITSMPAASYGGGYFAVGDWHDTLLLSEMGGGNNLQVRTQTDVFTGKVVVHCHILEHEDEGMMNIMEVVGTEGATYAAAETLDPTCYRTAFVASQSNSPASSPTASPAASPGTSPTASPAVSPVSSGKSDVSPLLSTNSAACFGPDFRLWASLALLAAIFLN
jgi:FtsP/CotA-like multicopper oxidase with cupredoxin domain